MTDTEMLDAMKTIIGEAEQRISKNTIVLMESEFAPKFDLLAEGQRAILDKLPNEDDLEIMDGRIATLEAIVRKLSREVAELKKAN